MLVEKIDEGEYSVEIASWPRRYRQGRWQWTLTVCTSRSQMSLGVEFFHDGKHRAFGIIVGPVWIGIVGEK